MVNPDGVFLGNSRCNWHGVDLNRKWDIPDATAPEVLLIKRHIE
jgi:murein tripeptide amidase MpaA